MILHFDCTQRKLSAGEIYIDFIGIKLFCRLSQLHSTYHSEQILLNCFSAFRLFIEND